MKPITMKRFFLCISFLFSVTLHAQANPDNYWNVVKERADKIVKQLSIKDAEKSALVATLIAQEYIDIKKLDEEKDEAIKVLKASSDATATIETALKNINIKSEENRDALNKKFIGVLGTHLSNRQIESVKNGMTYNVFHNTYKAYQEMIPQLKRKEKKYIYSALNEAREHAMAAGSSDAKHAWFGKYKGRINNYLSTRGYDMNKEGKAWQERIKANQKNQ